MNFKEQQLTKEYLLWLFKYDKENGKLYWKNHWRKCSRNRYYGKEAGSIQIFKRTKYRSVYFNDFGFQLHRLIYFLEKKEWPKQIDHIDGNGLNNRISNLRASFHRNNSCNKYFHREGKLVGTSYKEKINKWVSRIHINGKQIYLGCFRTEEEAHFCYLMARELYGV